MTLTNKIIDDLRHEQNMMKIELDERHKEMLRKAFELGQQSVKNNATS